VKQLSSGVWLPDGDSFFTSRPDYERTDFEIAMRHVVQRRTAIDVGAHIGFWTTRLASSFSQVVAIEPVFDHFACLKENTKSCNNVTLLHCAANNTSGAVKINVTVDNSGMSHIGETGEDVASITIDSLRLDSVDFVKIDVEGFEPNVLLGAENTINKHRPIIFVEILNQHRLTSPVFSLLDHFGYKLEVRHQENYLFRSVN
jgi:FkbM family methyltransferase